MSLRTRKRTTSSRSKGIRFLTLLLGLVWIQAGTAGAQEEGITLSFQVAVKQELIHREPPYYRAYITAGAAKLAFLVPDGYQVIHNPARKELNLNHRENGIITLSFTGALPLDANGLTIEGCREKLLSLYPGAKILEEFSRPICGPGGRVFDIKWQAAGKVIQCVRVAFVPTPAGVMLLRASTSPDKFSNIKPGLDLVMTTLCASADGELKVIALSDNI